MRPEAAGRLQDRDGNDEELEGNAPRPGQPALRGRGQNHHYADHEQTGGKQPAHDRRERGTSRGVNRLLGSAMGYLAMGGNYYATRRGYRRAMGLLAIPRSPTIGRCPPA